MSRAGIGLREDTPRSPPRRLCVVALTQLTPRLRRVQLAGDLADFPLNAEGSHIKLFFKRAGQQELSLPGLGPDGIVWPPHALRPIARTFSVSAFDAERRLLSVDFVLHGDTGPATSWASHVQVGDELGVAGPGGPNPLLGPASYYVLVGDLTALPAISALLAAMPADTRGYVLLEAPSADDMLVLQKPDGVTVHWLFRAAYAPSQLPAQVRGLPLEAASTFVFIAGESATVVAIRDHLLSERGFARRQLYATPYWREQQTEEEYHAERHRIMDELFEVAEPAVASPARR
jgi:NADPH-dependent ferric siderophore reductase